MDGPKRGFFPETVPDKMVRLVANIWAARVKESGQKAVHVKTAFKQTDVKRTIFAACDYHEHYRTGGDTGTIMCLRARCLGWWRQRQSREMRSSERVAIVIHVLKYRGTARRRIRRREVRIS